LLAAISVDLDEVALYRKIHGLPAPQGEGGPLVYRAALPRAFKLAERLGIPLTFFAVSRDLVDPTSASALRTAISLGHTVESHSASHPYDLIRLGTERIRAEIRESFDDIERAVGARPVGFRAPGYSLSDGVLDALEEAGAGFDASAFPCPAYYLAKLAVLGAMFERGRHSASIVASPVQLFAPTEPYRPGKSWWRKGDRRLIEIPMRVTRGVRLPVIGTTLLYAGERGGPRLIDACGLPSSFSLELHGVDFLEPDDGVADLAKHQIELTRPLAQRLRILEACVLRLKKKGYKLVSLRDLAASVAAAHAQRHIALY